MLKIGLTGGIGSGKTTVAKIFELFYIPVYYADSIAKIIIESDKAKKIITSKFGNVYADGKLDNKKLAQIVFSNKEALNNLNEIVHPLVLEDYVNWCKSMNNEKITLIEAAILFESGFNKNVDKIITVTAPLEIKISRVCKRDNVNKDKVVERIKNQIPDEKKIQKSDFVIYNDDIKALIPQVEKIYNDLILGNF